MTTIEIANAALIKIGGKTINSFDDDLKEAELCRMRLPTILRSVLRGHVWAFAKKHVVLAPTSEVSPSACWKYVFNLPADYVRILRLYPQPFEQFGNKVLSNHTVINLSYVWDARVLDAAFHYPDDFGEAVASLLASDISVSMTQDLSFKNTYYQEFMEKVRSARFNGAVETNGQVIPAEQWIMAHTSFGDVDPSVRDLDAPAGGI